MADKTEREKIMTRIQALMNMADPEGGGSPQEIETAARKLKELMDQYNLTLLDVMKEKAKDPLSFIARTANTIMGGRAKKWHWGLARAIASITNTKYYSMSAYGKTLRHPNGKNRRGSYMTFFGTEEQIQVACELFDRWIVRLQEMARAYTGEYCKEVCEEYGVKNAYWAKFEDPDEHPNVWRQSWTLGVVNGINNAIWEEERAQKRRDEEAQRAANKAAGISNTPIPTVTYALAVIGEAIEKAYTEHSIGFKKVNTSSSRRGNFAAYASGQAVGSKIRLNSKELKG